MADQLLRDAFAATIDLRGVPVRVRLANGDQVVVRALVSDVRHGLRDAGNGEDDEPRRQVQLFGETPDGIPLALARGNTVEIDDRGDGTHVPWAVEHPEARLACGIVKLRCIRVERKSYTGGANRDEARFTGGGRYRRQ